ncbi:hypothetical protein [Aquimarina sp. 2201CG5-10]|uniref:hypothetical protein n=1 Tax=Aquimarina callyspongiae TaxID=3098150 RepID=UPI002AB3627F|nr:hypothetical protein [Aquimarina sp. 2201CG5-10]MDY8136871.1 hypothetical protein [Aquimarina sp. 2201CG5-10]
MKTIKVFALICMILTLASCDDDDVDIVILNAEETGIFLEQDLHLRYLRQNVDRRRELIKELEAEGDPNNQIEELEALNVTDLNYANTLNDQISSGISISEVPRVPRIDPPLPPPPDPCNCLDRINMSKLKGILTIPNFGRSSGRSNGKNMDVSIKLRTEQQEELGSFGAPQNFDGTGLDIISLIGNIEYTGNVEIEVTKFFQPVNDMITYTLSGRID